MNTSIKSNFFAGKLYVDFARYNYKQIDTFIEISKSKYRVVRMWTEPWVKIEPAWDARGNSSATIF